MTAPGRPGSALVIGEALVDVVIHPGQEPVDIPGGSPANVALGLARLGRDAELHCWIGTDERGQAVRSHLEASGVRLAPGADGAARTSTAQATIGEDRAATYVFDLDWNPPRPALTDGQAPLLVHTGSIAAILAPGATTVEQVLRETRATSTIAYDPNARPQLMGEPEDAREVVERLVGLSDLVKCSDEDIAWLYGEGADLETVLRSWLEKGAAVVVVTRGKQGALALGDAPGGTRRPERRGGGHGGRRRLLHGWPGGRAVERGPRGRGPTRGAARGGRSDPGADRAPRRGHRRHHGLAGRSQPAHSRRASLTGPAARRS